jgi:hypothetical protein
LTVPLTLINGFGGIVAGIWLAVLGEWGAIGYGIAMLCIGGFLIGLAMMPGILVGAPAITFYEKGNKVGFYILGFLSALYTITVLTVWCVAILYFFEERAHGGLIVPLLLWSYGVATGPIGWLARKELESGNEYAMIHTFFVQVAYVLVILVLLVARISIVDVLVLFGIVMLVGLTIQFRIAVQEEEVRHQYNNQYNST